MNSKNQTNSKSNQLNRIPEAKRLRFGQVKVLMVEDDPAYRAFVRQVLSRNNDADFAFEGVGSLAACKQYLSQEITDVILLDLNLPDSAGIDTCANVMEIAGDSPILILTGSDSDTTNAGLEMLGLGAQDYLSKHIVSNDELIRCIRYAIGRKKFEESAIRLAAIKDFTATLAHDLRVPMIGSNKVLGALLDHEFGELSPEQSEALRAIKAANKAQLGLVKKLLELYRYELEFSKLNFEALDIGDVAKHSVSRISTLHKKNINLTIPANIQKVVGEKDALARLLDNLLDNAITHGDRSKAIELKIESSSQQIFVHVHNYGKPISPDKQAILFESFWQGVPGKTYVAQTGMGLYHCSRIANMHRAKLSCQSSAEAGTTMTLRIPLYSQ